MAELNYRLNVWGPTGSGPRQILRDASFITGEGLGLPLTPEGDALEGRFRAKGAGILIPPLSAVQIEYNLLGSWMPIYYGQVRQGGNALDVQGERYVLRSLALRLGGVTLSKTFATPQQAAHLTVRALIQDVLADLDGLILYDETLCPDLGFDLAPVENANQQNPLALLEKIKQEGLRFGVNVRFGVRPDRKFFCRVAKSDLLTLSAEDLSKAPEYKPPIAETPCTAVLWFLSRRMDGSWLTHESVSSEAVNYGKWVKTQSIAEDQLVWRLGSFTVVATDDAGHILNDTPELREALTDEPSTRLKQAGAWPMDMVVVNAETDSGTVSLVITVQEAAEFMELAGFWDNGDPAQNRLEIERPGQAVEIISSTDLGAQQFNDHGAITISVGSARTAYFKRTLQNLPAGTILRFIGVSKPSAAEAHRKVYVYVYEARPEVPLFDLLDGLATYHYQTPAQDPADLTLREFLAPTSLSGRVKLEDYERNVSGWEYRITSARGLEVAALTEQAEDPAALALASLVKARDGKATIDALTAQR